MSLVLLLLAIAIALVLIMAAAWGLILKTGKSGWADTFWSAGIGLVGCVAVLVPLGTSMPRPLIVAILLAIWSLRLASHIGHRTLQGEDDPRYAQLRKDWGENYRSRLFGFLQIQAVAAFVLVGAALAAAHNPAPLGWTDGLGVAIAIAAMVGEAISDAQLAGFKANPANKGKVCDTGLWSLSRHPNYFFEWLYWLAYVAIGIGYPWGWISLAAPLMMYWLLVHVSGVPPLEAHMLRSRGDAFRDYQSRVRAFWPIPRRGVGLH